MKRLIVLFLMVSGSPMVLADGSPWLPSDGSISISADLVTGSTDEFFIGDQSMNLGGDIEGTFVFLNASYGYDDIWAFDFRTGYAQSRFDQDNFVGEQPEQDDISDTSFGVSYQFINEFEADNGWPTIAVRGGFTIGGDYETNVIEAIGDGASGVDLSLLVGKSLNTSISVAGDLTFRQRNNEVAEAVKYIVSGFYSTPLQGLGLRASFAGTRTDSDVNIGDPGFNARFPETDRDSDWLILGANYSFVNGIGAGFSFSSVLSGRNVADSSIGMFSLSYSL